MPRLLVFTGGGLSPSLNPTIYGVLNSARKKGYEIWGGLYGWASMLDNGRCVRLDNLDLQILRERGGTILRSSRTNPLKIERGIDQVKDKIIKHKFDGIIAIGGDDTLGAARALAAMDLPVIGVPKTIDNDISGTYFTPGFPTAAHYLADFTRQIKQDAAYALSRIFVIESLGMKAGWLAAAAALGGADVVIPPEGTHDLKHLLSLISQRYEANGNYAVVVVAQEANFKQRLAVPTDNQCNDQYGHERRNFVCLSLRSAIRSKLGIDTKALYPGNFLETDTPISIDRDMAIKLGEHAIQMFSQKHFGKMACIVYKHQGKNKLSVAEKSLTEAVGEGKYRGLPKEYFDFTEMLPTKKFRDYMSPILGKDNYRDIAYEKLIKKISTKVDLGR